MGSSDLFKLIVESGTALTVSIAAFILILYFMVGLLFIVSV